MPQSRSRSRACSPRNGGARDLPLAGGEWILPAEAVLEGGKWIHKTTGEVLTTGGIEKMSKSKKNVVDPEAILDEYGADTARWFMLSDTPPERDIEWTETGVEGAWRFTQRFGGWFTRLRAKSARQCPRSQTMTRGRARIAAGQPSGDPGGDRRYPGAQVQPRHRPDLRARQPDDCGAPEARPPDAMLAALKEAAEALVLLMAPMMPHLAEECWRVLGHSIMVVATPWPRAEESFLVRDHVTMAVAGRRQAAG